MAMQKELILQVDEDVLEKAAKYAEAHGQSLPELLQEHVFRLAEVASEGPLSPQLQRLYGALQLPTGVEAEAVLADALLKKYVQ